MEVDDAIKVAMAYVEKHFGGSSHRLEEIELLDVGDFEITVSYRGSGPGGAQSMTFGGTSGFESMIPSRRAAIGVDPSRTFKDVLIGKDGHIKAVRMRQIVVG